VRRSRAGARLGDAIGVIGAALLLLSPAFADSAPTVASPSTGGLKPPEWQRFGIWRQADGLPQESVFALLQSRDGYLWMGTKGGLTRFDGVRFTTFDDRDPRQLHDNEVWSIAEAKDGSIWAATYGGGVSRYQNGDFTVYTSARGLVSDYAAVVAADTEGGMWVGTDRGVTHIQDGKLTSFTTQEGLPGNVIRAVYADGDGSVWIGTSKGGVARYDHGRVETLAFDGPPLTGEVRCFWRASADTLWIATYDGIAKVEGRKLTLYTADDGLPVTRIRQISGSPDGGLLIGSEHGLDHVAFENGRLIVTPVLGDTSTMSFCFDHEGSLWVGTFLDGLQRLRKGLFASYSAVEGMGGYTAAVLEDRAGAIWLGTRKGVGRLANGRADLYDETNGLAKSSVYALLEDAQGHLWVGTSAGVYRSEGAACALEGACHPRFSAVEVPGLGHPYTRVLYQDRAGGVWIGTDQEGLARWRDGAFEVYGVKEGLANGSVRAIAQDREGALWIGTRGGGVSRLKDGAFKTYTMADGLAGDSVQALYLDVDGALWVATRQGVSRYRDGRFTTYTVNEGLFVNYVYSFAEDGRGYLWMASARGVSRVRKSDFDDLGTGKIHTLAADGYRFEHGLRGQPVAGSHPAAIRARDGRLWFATSTGVSVLDPGQLSHNANVPPVHVEAIVVDDKELRPASGLEVLPARGTVAFRYTALSFVAPEKVRFKYRLDGFDGDWVDAENRRVAYYTNLPPGRYHFRVTASNNDGVWNESAASVDLRLLPRFYQTYWFYGLCVAGIGALGAGTQRLRMRVMQARQKELALRVEEAVAHIKRLRGLLPICASCKKIRDDKGYWNQMETYIQNNSEADFSHSICPTCMEKLYPEYVEKTRAAGQ
jgi:ligand-binding sensor domain-containing protein